MLAELEQSAPVNWKGGSVRSSVRAPKFDLKHLEKAEGRIDRNVVNMFKKIKAIALIFSVKRKTNSLDKDLKSGNRIATLKRVTVRLRTYIKYYKYIIFRPGRNLMTEGDVTPFINTFMIDLGSKSIA